MRHHSAGSPPKTSAAEARLLLRHDTSRCDFFAGRGSPVWAPRRRCWSCLRRGTNLGKVLSWRVTEKGADRGSSDGTFTDTTRRAGVTGGDLWAMGAVASDIDNDGDPDLLRGL